MLKHIWSVLSERSSCDASTGLVSLLTCIEGISAPNLPVSMQNLTLSSRWYNSGSKDTILTVALDILQPDGKVEHHSELPPQEIKAKTNHRTFIILNKMPLTHEGTYNIQVKFQKGTKWEIATEIPLDITLNKK